MQITLCVLCAANAASADVSVVDDVGRTVSLSHPAQRIVSLAPHLTELVYAAGAGKHLVAVSDFSDFPPEARALPRVSASGAMDLEAIIALAPDLIIGWNSAGYSGQLARLTRFGAATFISEPHNLRAIGESIKKIGVLTGTEENAENVAATLDRRLLSAENTYSVQRRVRVFYQLWNDPLMTIGADHIINDALRVCGAASVFEDLDGLAATVEWETTVLRNPELVVFSVGEQATSQWRAQWAKWPAVTAVRYGHIAGLPSDLINRATPRMVDAVERLCRHVEAARSAIQPGSTSR